MIVGLNSYTFDYNRVLTPALDSHVLKSEAICRYTGIQKAVESIACDCFSNEKDCFSASNTVPVGSVKPCVGEDTTFAFPGASFRFFVNSVTSGCTNLRVSQVSAYWFKGESKVTLSGNFVSFLVNREYQIYNNKKASIGVIIDDGVHVEVDTRVSSYQICIDKRKDIPQDVLNDYPILDFGRSDKLLTTIVPAELTVTVNEKGQYCSIVNNPSVDERFYPSKQLNPFSI